jgi:hypothetical protein
LFAPEHMRAARAAMLQAALQAFFMDVQADDCDGLLITLHIVDGDLSIEATQMRQGQPMVEWTL